MKKRRKKNESARGCGPVLLTCSTRKRTCLMDDVDDEMRGRSLRKRRCTHSRFDEGVGHRGQAQTGVSQRIACGAPVALHAEVHVPRLHFFGCIVGHRCWEGEKLCTFLRVSTHQCCPAPSPNSHGVTSGSPWMGLGEQRSPLHSGIRRIAPQALRNVGFSSHKPGGPKELAASAVQCSHHQVQAVKPPLQTRLELLRIRTKRPTSGV